MGLSAEPALLIVSLLSLFLTAHGAECNPNVIWAANPGMTWGEAWSKAFHEVMPCTFGNCIFFTDASGVLDRTGSCPGQTGDLYLSNKGINALKDGVFNNTGAWTGIYLSHNQLSSLPETIFRGLTSLESIVVDDNRLSNVPESIFRGLTSLR